MIKKILFFFTVIKLIFFVNLSVYPLDILNKKSDTIEFQCNFPQQGKIFFVTGSCSSGKSSIVNCLAQKLDAKIFKFDDYVMPIILKKFIEKHYGKLLASLVSSFVMRNFFTTVNFLSEKQKYEFQKKFYADLSSGLADKPTRKMYSEAKSIAQEGRNVVIESPMFLWEEVNLLSNLEVLGKKT